MSRRRGGDDAGSATIWVLTVALALAAVCGVSVCTGVAVLTRHRAAAAADAAALAGALHLDEGADQVCLAVRKAAAANGARATDCTPGDGDVVATVVVPAPRWLGWLGPACGRARAGQIPASSGEPTQAGPGRNLTRSTSLCPTTKPRQ